MDATFGSRLRSQREQRQIPLAAISEQTKIKRSLLEALERDDLSNWPLGIFGRSYIRAYAQAVGLDPEATVREFAERVRPPLEAHPAAIAEARERSVAPPSRRPPTRLESLIDSAIDAFHSRRAELRERNGVVPEGAGAASVDASIACGEEPVAPVQAAAAEAAPAAAIPIGLDFPALADLCTRLSRAREAPEVTSALEDAAALVDAVGLTLWLPDSLGVALTAVFAHGYPDELIAQLPRVPVEANNASAEAFRTRAMAVVSGSGERTGALVAPLLTPSGCSGVVAIELRNGAEDRDDVRAAVTILAAQLSTVLGVSVLAQTRTA
jgi:hypothetical protein